MVTNKDIHGNVYHEPPYTQEDEAEFYKRVSSIPDSAQRSIVPVRRIFFCNNMTPYSSASAVGGQLGT